MSDEMPVAIEGTPAAPPSSTDIPTLLKDAIAAYKPAGAMTPSG